MITTEHLDPAGGFDITDEGEPCPQFLYSGLPFNVLEIRHPECNRHQLDSADGYLYFSASRGHQRLAMQPF